MLLLMLVCRAINNYTGKGKAKVFQLQARSVLEGEYMYISTIC
jgi:hypothetical protein